MIGKGVFMPSLSVLKEDLKDSVSSQIFEDIQIYKEKMSFENDHRMRLHFQRVSGVLPSSINRIIYDKKLPLPQTIYNIYSTIHETKKYEDLFEKIPKDVAEFLKRSLLKSSLGEERCEKTEKYVLDNQIAMRIYNDCAGFGTSLKEIKRQYGEYGIAEANKLKEMKVLEIKESGHVSWGKIRITATPTTIKRQLLFNTEAYYRPLKSMFPNENIIFTRIENVSQDAYVRIIKEYKKAYENINDIINLDAQASVEQRMDVKVFLGGIVDKVNGL